MMLEYFEPQPEEEAEKQLLFEYETVRRSGACNMYVTQCVASIAADLELWGLVELAENGQAYVDFLARYEPPDEDEYQKWLNGY